MDHLSESDQRDIEALRAAIIEFTNEHRERPFGALREIGVQAALKRLADKHLGANATVDAILVDKFDKPICGGNNIALEVNTDRVRLEAKILPPTRDGASKSAQLKTISSDTDDTGGKDDRTDLLLYKSSMVKLVRYPNGPGDIVYRAFPESVLAAVEIKADPSHSADQKRGYGNDIQRLLRLQAQGIAGFFLILDKSSSFYGEFARHRKEPLDCIDWGPVSQPARLSNILRGRSKNKADYSQWANILISRTPPEQGYIEIYNISANDDAKQKYYAYSS